MNNKEPFVHIIKRSDIKPAMSWGIRAAAVLLALVVCGIITSSVTKENPIEVYSAIWDGSFGTARKRWILLQNMKK